MSEPKTFTFGLGRYTENGSPCVVAFDGEGNPRLASDEKFYLKSEADRYINDIVNGAISMFRNSANCRGLDTKSPLGRIADVGFKYWMDVERTRSNNAQLRKDKADLLRTIENLRSGLKEETLIRINEGIHNGIKLNHQKRKRCLDKAKWCDERIARYTSQQEIQGISWRKEINFYRRLHDKYVELAEKFKEAKV